MKAKILLYASALAAFALRLLNIEQKNMWFDEVYTWHLSQKTIKEIFIGSAGDIHPPLFYILLKYWTYLFSDTVFSMRLLSVLLGVFSLVFIYKISIRILKSDYLVLFVFILYALSPLNIYYSQEVRMLNLNLFLCLGSVYFFLKYTESQVYRNGLPYLLFSILAVYTHYFAFLVIFTQVLIVLYNYFRKKDAQLLKRYPVYIIAILIMYVPWIPVMLSQVSKGQPWRTEQSALMVFKNSFEYFKETFFSYYIYYETLTWVYISLAATLLLILYLCFNAFRLKSNKFNTPEQRNLLYVVLFFFIPLAAGIAISLKNSILLSRYLSIIVPYLLISLTALTFLFYKQKTAVIILSIIILISGMGVKIHFENSFKNNDYRKVISYIEQNYDRNDMIHETIIVEPHYMAWSLEYYVRHNTTVLPEPVNMGWNFNGILDSLNIKKDIGNFWIVLDYSSMDTLRYKELPAVMSNLGYRQESEKRFYIIPNKVSVQRYVKP